MRVTIPEIPDRITMLQRINRELIQDNERLKQAENAYLETIKGLQEGYIAIVSEFAKIKQYAHEDLNINALIDQFSDGMNLEEKLIAQTLEEMCQHHARSYVNEFLKRISEDNATDRASMLASKTLGTSWTHESVPDRIKAILINDHGMKVKHVTSYGVGDDTTVFILLEECEKMD